MGKKNWKSWKIDGKTYRVTLDKFLADKRLTRKSIAKDGSCLFRAVSEQVGNTVVAMCLGLVTLPDLRCTTVSTTTIK